MKEENLIALMYSPNPSYTTIKYISELKKDEKFSIDLEKKLWSYKLKNRTETTKIGEPSYGSINHENKIIGLYDRSDIEHLNKMISNMRERTTKYDYF